MALELKGHYVIVTEDGAKAWETMHSAVPELLLIDIMMPHPGGYQLVRRLDFEPAMPLPRVIFLAAPHMESEARLLARTCVASRQVVDANDTDALLAMVETALAAPPPVRNEPGDANDDGSSLYPIVDKLYQRVTELQTFNVRLGRHAAMGVAQLEVARSALKREVIKRLRTEQAMLLENQQLRTQSMRDPLTGLYNRRYLEESLVREQSRAKRSGKPLGMIMASIDHFKRCNDTYGHVAGDVVLRSVAQCMESLARAEDMLCRYGGGEFVLVMTNTVPGMLRQRAAALSASVTKLYIEHDHRHIGPVTVSIGLASFPEHGETAQAALQSANAALQQATMLRGNRIAAAGELSGASN